MLHATICLESRWTLRVATYIRKALHCSGLEDSLRKTTAKSSCLDEIPAAHLERWGTTFCDRRLFQQTQGHGNERGLRCQHQQGRNLMRAYVWAKTMAEGCTHQVNLSIQQRRCHQKSKTFLENVKKSQMDFHSAKKAKYEFYHWQAWIFFEVQSFDHSSFGMRSFSFRMKKNSQSSRRLLYAPSHEWSALFCTKLEKAARKNSSFWVLRQYQWFINGFL